MGSPIDLAETARRRRWQGVTVATLFVGYAGYYVCRSNLSVASPLLLADYESQGLTKAHIGDVASLGVLFYAIGKLLNGVAADLFGGRRLFLLGMFASVGFTLLFAMSSLLAAPFTGIAGSLELPVAALLPFFVLWAGNRFVQSMGWGGLVQITSRWFSVSRLATVMGVLTMSYLLGDALARLYLGGIVYLGADWRGVFAAAAAVLGVIAVVSLFTLKQSPRDVGLTEPPPPPRNVYGDVSTDSRLSIWQILRPLLTNATFWIVCVLNIGLTLIRETFNLWTPTYLRDVAHLDPGIAGMASVVFPLSGAVSAIGAGWLVDRLNGRYGIVLTPCLLGLVGMLVLFVMVPIGEWSDGVRAVVVLSMIAAVAFFLLAPYTFCSGALSVKIGGQRGGSTAAGIVDTCGYLGATLAGSGVGRIADRLGWSAAFEALAGVAALTLVVAVVYAIRTRHDRTHAPDQDSP